MKINAAQFELPLQANGTKNLEIGTNHPKLAALPNGIKDPEIGTPYPESSNHDSGPLPIGTMDPKIGTPLPESKWAAVDWSHKGCHVTSLDGQGLESGGSGTLRKWLEMNPDLQILIEPTFESFNLEERARVIEEHGRRMWKVPSRWTEGERRRRKLKKSDFTDSAVIFSALAAGIHLSRVRAYNIPDRSWQKAVAINRAAGWPEENPPQLPDPKTIKEIPALKQTLLETNTRYRGTFVWPLVIAAQHSATMREFDRLVGAYGHGYPNILRSNFYYNRVRALEKKLGHKDAMRANRRATRWVYHHVRAWVDSTKAVG